MWKKLTELTALLMVLFAIGYNLFTYRLEPTAKIDPNDNPFQYALVHRTNEMWDFAARTCPKNLLFPLCFTGFLTDHWVPNWAQGFNLPYYYGHWPQIIIVATWRILNFFIVDLTLFSWYHVVIYLLLCLFPISVYIALRVLKAPYLTAGFGALLASQVSTDGLYGLDPSSFLWRGYGLSSQLFAMVWMPLAIAYSLRFFQEPFDLLHLIKKPKELFLTIIGSTNGKLAILFMVATVSGHLGIGVIGMMSIGIMALTPAILGLFYKINIKDVVRLGTIHLGKLAVVAGIALIILAYFVLPAQLNARYHNLSFWDPVWKFDSWGWKEVMNLFTNGELFDFGRSFPFFTGLLILGGFGVFFLQDEDKKEKAPYASFAFLFIFWLVMFFGRATWGGLIDLIPSMRDFHQSRFIVGVHLTGMFLAPFGFLVLCQLLEKQLVKIAPLVKTFLASLDENDDQVEKGSHTLEKKSGPFISLFAGVVLSIIAVLAIYPQTSRYAAFNDTLIKRGNENFDKQNPDVQKLFADLNKLPNGRVFTGRGGQWGKKLTIAETTYFIHLSTYGVRVILWLPETWSPSSDVEQFFIEERPEHYDLMNIRYVVTTPDVEPQKFWKLVDTSPVWKLYQVDTGGYFGVGSKAAVVYSGKEWYVNVVRFWLQSDYPKNKVFPELTFNKNEMMTSPIPAFGMIDEARYLTRDNKMFNLYNDIPSYEAPAANLSVIGPEVTDTDMIFKTKVHVDSPCTRCFVFLKESSHPSWKAYINGKPAKTFVSFPFYTGVTLTEPGDYTVEFRYEPAFSKLFLFVLGGVVLLFLFLPWKQILKERKVKDGEKK